jgi:hypothetical protein
MNYILLEQTLSLVLEDNFAQLNTVINNITWYTNERAIIGTFWSSGKICFKKRTPL